MGLAPAASRRLKALRIPILAILFSFVTLAVASGSSTSSSKRKVAQISAEGSAPPLEMPSVNVLAKDLGYDPKDLRKAVDDFALALSQGSASVPLKRLCAKDEDTCRLVRDFQDQAQDAKRDRQRARRTVKRFRVNEGNIDQAQRFDFQVLVNSLRVENEARLTDLAQKALSVKDCPRNLSAALAVKAEEYFPAEGSRKLARQLLDHTRPCLDPKSYLYERLHLRGGLYGIYDGDLVRAKSLLRAAKFSVDQTERYRVLYWLGWLAHNEKVKPQENEDWLSLQREFPLSFYSIDSSVRMGKDPMELIKSRPVQGVSRTAEDDPELNRMIRWLEALYVFKKPSAVARWASWIVRASEGELSGEILHYLGTIKIAAGMYRSNISMLFSYFRKNPESLNKESLLLLYPRPYYNLIQGAARGRIDTFLVLGLVRQESAFDPRAVSRAKAKGLMQIIPQTARRLASQGHRKLMNEKENTEMGVRYLLQLGEKFDGSAELVLAGYNAGPQRVVEWLQRNPNRAANPLLWNDLIPFMETRDYVASILRNNYIYARLYDPSVPVASGVFSSSLVQELIRETPKTGP
jgi:soluble lytic murein transglycosylase